MRAGEMNPATNAAGHARRGSRIWLAAALQAATLLLLFLGPQLEAGIALAGGIAPQRWVGPALQTLALLAGAHLTNRVVDSFIWEGVFARVTGGRVPGILKTLLALAVYLVTASIIVGAVYERSVAGFLTALGAGGVVLGLAVRGIFEDLFTGLAVNVDRNLRIGDWIALPERVVRPNIGRIREIGWRCTQLETEEGTMLILPNGVLGREVLTNLTRPSAPTRYECSLALDQTVPCERGGRAARAGARYRKIATHDQGRLAVIFDNGARCVHGRLDNWLLYKKWTHVYYLVVCRIRPDSSKLACLRCFDQAPIGSFSSPAMRMSRHTFTFSGMMLRASFG